MQDLKMSSSFTELHQGNPKIPTVLKIFLKNAFSHKEGKEVSLRQVFQKRKQIFHKKALILILWISLRGKAYGCLPISFV